MQIQPDVDALVLQAFDPPVQLFQHGGAQVLSVQGPLIAEDVGIDPGRVVVNQAH